METYRFALSVQVEVEAYSEEDARDMVQDVFGPGNDCGVEVKSLSIENA